METENQAAEKKEREKSSWRERERERDFIGTGRNICSDKKSRSRKVAHRSLGRTGLTHLPFVDTPLGDVDTSKVLEEGVHPGDRMRLNRSGQTAERKRMGGTGVEPSWQVLPMIPARPRSSGASGSIVPERIAERRHYKTSTVSSEPLRIAEHHSLARPTNSRSSPFVELVEGTAWPQPPAGAKSVAERGEVVG